MQRFHSVFTSKTETCLNLSSSDETANIKIKLSTSWRDEEEKSALARKTQNDQFI